MEFERYHFKSYGGIKMKNIFVTILMINGLGSVQLQKGNKKAISGGHYKKPVLFLVKHLIRCFYRFIRS